MAHGACWIMTLKHTTDAVFVHMSSWRCLVPYNTTSIGIKMHMYIQYMWSSLHACVMCTVLYRTATPCHYNGILRKEYDWSTKLCHHLFGFLCKTWLPYGISLFHRIYCASHLLAHCVSFLFFSSVVEFVYIFAILFAQIFYIFSFLFISANFVWFVSLPITNESTMHA